MASPGTVGLAFGLVLASGASTAVGASTVFFSRHTNHLLLAAALGVSAGVMIYVSFVEIFSAKSIDGFLSAGYSEDEATRYSALCFFGGMVVLWLLDKAVHGVLHLALRFRNRSHQQEQIQPPTKGPFDGQAEVQIQMCPGDEEVTSTGSAGGPMDATVHVPHEAREAVDTIINAEQDDPHRKGLSRMGLLAALAIGLHNLPEGLATFVGTMADATAGVAIAIAIILHNIPEGIVVAMPIYYASGSKWKGFLWGCFSGFTEPVGALIGYAILKGQDMDPMIYAVMFGLVAGMMIYISLSELLPTALKYDPSNRVTTWAVVAGMAVMAASLLLFAAA